MGCVVLLLIVPERRADGLQVDFVLPEELYALTEARLKELGPLRYSRVYMSLLEVISGDFFNHYIKIGQWTRRRCWRRSC
jgi:hypothetical protein